MCDRVTMRVGGIIDVCQENVGGIINGGMREMMKIWGIIGGMIDLIAIE